MKARLYTMLRIKGKKELNIHERLLWYLVNNVSLNEYIDCIVLLRDNGLIDEVNNGESIVNRLHSITKKGYEHLPNIKKSYLMQLLRENLKWLIMFLLGVATFLFGSCLN